MLTHIRPPEATAFTLIESICRTCHVGGLSNYQKGSGPTDPHYVDTLGFFGINVRGPDSSHADHQRTFNVTELVKSLDAKGLLTPTPTVTAEPSGELGGGIPTIGRVVLIAG